MSELKSLKQITELANKISVDKISPEEIQQDLLSEDEILTFLQLLSVTHGIPIEAAFIVTSLLFLKGACNRSAPKKISVTVSPADSLTEVHVTKYDLEYVCERVFSNKYLRRIAEGLAINICIYAEKNNLNGDLANSLNKIAVAQGEPPLSKKEKAWACSFCQGVENLDEKASKRLASLLAIDYNNRFGGKQQSSKKPKKELQERNWRAGKPAKKTSDDVGAPTESKPAAKKGKNKKG